MNMQSDERLPTFSPFWPLCIMAASLIVVLGWQVTVAARQYIALVRFGEQQAVLWGQASQTETRLQSMVMDLLNLSKTNSAAMGIVTKHGIKFTPPAAPAPAVPVEKILPELKSKAK